MDQSQLAFVAERQTQMHLAAVEEAASAEAEEGSAAAEEEVEAGWEADHLTGIARHVAQLAVLDPSPPALDVVLPIQIQVGAQEEAVTEVAGTEVMETTGTIEVGVMVGTVAGKVVAMKIATVGVVTDLEAGETMVVTVEE